MSERTKWMLFGIVWTTLGLSILIGFINAIGIISVILGIATIAGSHLMSDEEMESND